jgi:hypothetical protein
VDRPAPSLRTGCGLTFFGNEEAKEEAKEDEVGKPGGEEGIGVRELHHHLMRPDLFDVSGNGTVRPADRVVVAVLELSCDCTTLVIHIGGFH